MQVTHRAPRDSIAPDETERGLEIITAVAEASGVDPMALPPLYDVVDPDTIDAVMERSDESFELSFDFADVHVAVTTDEVLVEA